MGVLLKQRGLTALGAQSRTGDVLFVMLIGHGSGDGTTSKFAIPGPDITANDFARVLDGIGGPTIAFVNTSSASGGFIGTLSGARTTPEAPELQALLAEHRRRGDAAVAVEVSSHGLDQGRVAATHFAVAMFTNLSQDHLDYHGTMDEYFEAKARLFAPGYTRRAVVCVDEPWGRRAPCTPLDRT